MSVFQSTGTWVMNGDDVVIIFISPLKAMVGQEDDPAAGAFAVKLLEGTCGAPESSTG